MKAVKPKAVVYLTSKFSCFHCKENLHWLQREALQSLVTSGSPKDNIEKIFKWQQTKSGWGFVCLCFVFSEKLQKEEKTWFSISEWGYDLHTLCFFAPVRDIYGRIATTLNLVSYSHFIMFTTGRGGGRFEESTVEWLVFVAEYPGFRLQWLQWVMCHMFGALVPSDEHFP